MKRNKKHNATWGGTPWNIKGTSLYGRWHETPRDVFRFVGNAHDIVNLQHTGWYLDDVFQCETTHGQVFQLSHGRFLAAGSDAYNDGAAYFETDKDGNPIFYEDKEEAARAADYLAEQYAEVEREFQNEDREEQRKHEEQETALELESALCSLE